jgi:hypothetical protein
MSNTIKIIGLIVLSLISCKKETNPLDYTKKLNGNFYFSGLNINEATNPFEINEYSTNINISYINNKTLVLPVFSLLFIDTFYYAYTDKNEKKIVYTYFFDDHDFLVKDTIIYYYDQNIIHYNGYLENSYGLVGRHKLKANM